MTRKGFLNSTSANKYEGDTKLFDFKKEDLFLKAEGFIYKRDLAELERVTVLLTDGRELKNVFIAFTDYWYYFEPEWYFEGPMNHADFVPAPPETIFKRFNFSQDDVEFIISDNELVLPRFDFWHKFTLFRNDPRTSKLSIRKNVLLNIGKWSSTLEVSNNKDLLYNKNAT